MPNQDKQQEQTIADFGDQWLHYRESEGYYGSKELLKDICEPLLDIQELVGKRALEIGSGTGRIVEMLLQAGAASVIAVEPSQAVQILRQRSAVWKDRVTIMEMKGESIPPGLELDFIFCIGVLHHIPEPLRTLHAALNALRPGGKLVLWVYGREGNALYLLFFKGLRRVAKTLSDPWLRRISRGLVPMVRLYARGCRLWPRWPLAEYLGRVFANLSKDQQELVIFDQLNPAYTRYYRRQEICDLVRGSGFDPVAAHRRHGYSWLIRAERPKR